MLIRSKRHWATLLTVGLPLLVAGCAGGGMSSHGGPTAATASAVPKTSPNTSHMDALSLAERLRAEGNFSSAASMFQQAAQANPGDVRPLLGLGDCLLAMGANADAAQAYGAATAIQPNNLEALRGLGHARILLGQPQFAVTHYQTALKVAPNDVRILNGLGVAQDMIGDHAAAQKAYHQVLTLDPANQSAKNNLALSMALAGDDAGAIKLLEDVSKSGTATSVNRQNLALLYGVSGQMAQAEQASRADLPPDQVNRNMAVMSASGDEARKQELLKQSLGVELKGRQYAPAAKPVTPLTSLAQTSSLDDQPVYMSSQEGESLPVITTDGSTATQTAQATSVTVKTTGKKDGWSDWDEELVDATDVNGATGAEAAATPAQPTTTSNISETTAAGEGGSSSAAGSGQPRFLSSANAIADDTAKTPAPVSASTPAAPAKPTTSSSTTATQTAALPPATTPTPDAEQPATAASTTPAANPAAPAEQPAATSSAMATAASTAAATTSGGDAAASAMTVTAKTLTGAKVYTVQIASYRSEQEASAGWQALTAEQSDLLAKLPHAVAKADLGAEKGIYYRLQAGTFSDRNEAKALCSDLKNHSIDCMVVEAAPAPAVPTSTQQSMLAPDDSIVIGAR